MLSTVVVALGILNGIWTYRPGIPLLGSCSAAISPACHNPKGNLNAATLPLLSSAVSGQDKRVIGHCCFTSFETSQPIEGKTFVGQRPENSVMATVLGHDGV